MLEERLRALQPLLEDEDAGIRQAAADALDALEAVMQLDSLLARLKTGARGERIAAAYALERVNSPKVFPPLLEASQSSDPDLRTVVVQVLGSKKHPKTLGPLVKLLDDPEPGVLVEVVRALAGFNDRRLPDCLAPLVTAENEQLALTAIETLGALAFPEGEAPLLAALEDPRPGVRRLAAQMLGRLHL